jgi:hypothetical protein
MNRGQKTAAFALGYGAPRGQKRSIEIRLDKSRTGVDVDPAQHRVTGVNEAMRCLRRNNDDTARFHLALSFAAAHLVLVRPTSTLHLFNNASRLAHKRISAAE